MKKVFLSSLLMLMGVGMANGQTAFVSVQQNGTSLAETLGTASYDLSSGKRAEMSFDSSGNAVMTYNGQTVAKLTESEVMDNGGELVGSLDGTETKVSRTIAKDFATLYSPFQLQIPADATVSVYVPKLSNGALTLGASNKISGIIPPCTALILYGDADSSIEFDYSAAAPQSISRSSLKGSAVSFANTAKESTTGPYFYTLAHEGGIAGFYIYRGDYLNAGKAYIYAAGGSNAKYIAFSFTDDEASSITDVNVDVNRDGKFIENGRVVILKNGRKFNTAGQQINEK